MSIALRQYKNVAEHFNCPIHLGKLRDPRRLACEHTFCADCLNHCIETSINVRTDGIFECPVCRRNHHVPSSESRDWARGFPVDAFCVIQLHTLAQYEESVVCERHIEKFKEYFCFHHRSMLCSDCIIEGHTKSPCSCGSLQDSILEVRLQIKELIGKLRLQEERAQRMLESKVAETYSDELMKKITEVEKTLTKFYKHMKSNLKASKQQVLESMKVSQSERECLLTLSSLISKTKQHVESVIHTDRKRKNVTNEIFSVWTPLEHETQNFDEALNDIETRPYCVNVKADEQFLEFISYNMNPLTVTTEKARDCPMTPNKQHSLSRLDKDPSVVEAIMDSSNFPSAPEIHTFPSPTPVRRTITLSTPTDSGQKLYDRRPSTHEEATPRRMRSRQVSPSRSTGNTKPPNYSTVFPKVATGELVARDTGKSIRGGDATIKGIVEVSNFELACGDIVLLDNLMVTLTESALQKFTLDYRFVESLTIKCPWRLCAIKDTTKIAVNHNTRFISIVGTYPTMQVLYRVETEKPYSQICHMRTQVIEDRFGKTKYHEQFALSHTTDLRADCIDLLKVSYDRNPFSNFTPIHVTRLVPIRTKSLICSDKHAIVRSPNSLAATSDGKRLIIGAESAVVCIRKTGDVVWKLPVVRFISSVCCNNGLIFVCIENERRLMILTEGGISLFENIFPLGCSIVRPNRVSVERGQMIVREFTERDWKSTVHVFSMTY